MSDSRDQRDADQQPRQLDADALASAFDLGPAEAQEVKGASAQRGSARETDASGMDLLSNSDSMLAPVAGAQSGGPSYVEPLDADVASELAQLGALDEMFDDFDDSHLPDPDAYPPAPAPSPEPATGPVSAPSDGSSAGGHIDQSALLAAMGGSSGARGQVVETEPLRATGGQQVTADAFVAAAMAGPGGFAPPVPAAEPPAPAEAQPQPRQPHASAGVSGGGSGMSNPTSDPMHESALELPTFAMEQGKPTQLGPGASPSSPFHTPVGAASGRGVRIAPMDEDDFEEHLEDLEPERTFDDVIKSMRLVGTCLAQPVEAAELSVMRRD